MYLPGITIRRANPRNFYTPYPTSPCLLGVHTTYVADVARKSSPKRIVTLVLLILKLQHPINEYQVATEQHAIVMNCPVLRLLLYVSTSNYVRRRCMCEWWVVDVYVWGGWLAATSRAHGQAASTCTSVLNKAGESNRWQGSSTPQQIMVQQEELCSRTSSMRNKTRATHSNPTKCSHSLLRESIH